MMPRFFAIASSKLMREYLSAVGSFCGSAE
jgi:hypothetical protein